MPRRPSNTLTEAELRLMRLLWRTGECSVQDLVSAMPEAERLAYTSVLTTVRILETKGYVEHRQEGAKEAERPTMMPLPMLHRLQVVCLEPLETMMSQGANEFV